MISVRSSVSAPSATSHTRSLMDEASSKTRRMRLPWLCKPAKASVLVSDHGTISQRQVRSCFGSRAVIDVAPKLHQCLCSASLYHFASSGHVLVRSCTSVLAVITALQSGWPECDLQNWTNCDKANTNLNKCSLNLLSHLEKTASKPN